MTFGEIVSKYIDELGITAKELAKYSRINASTISRYRSGERIPAKDSKQYNNLISGFDIALKKCNREDITIEGIKKEIEDSLSNEMAGFSHIVFRYNLISLMDTLKISEKEMANAVGYDISYISRIRTGKRKPADPENLIRNISSYISKNYNDPDSIKNLSGLLNCWEGELASSENIYKKIYMWLLEDANSRREYIEELIKKLDTFDDNEYHKTNVRDIVNKIEDKYPDKDYKYEIKYGLDNLKESEFRFIKKVVSSKKDKSLSICWDIPGDVDEGLDEEFMSILAVLIDMGMDINVIQADDGPMSEMITWLIKWMPIYMTGKVKPYFIERSGKRVFSNSILVSENELMCVDAVEGHFDSARIMLSSNKDDIGYYRSKIEKLTDISYKMVDVIHESEKERRQEFLKGSIPVRGKRKNLLATPPIYTMSDKLLNHIFDENKVDKEDRKVIRNYIRSERKRVMDILEHSEQEDHIPNLPRESFEKNPMYLSLSGLFYHKYIYYNYEDYQEHMRLTKELEANNNNYSLILREDMSFRNIQLFMLKDRWVVISKNRTPAIHFIVTHPEMRESLEKMIEMY